MGQACKMADLPLVIFTLYCRICPRRPRQREITKRPPACGSPALTPPRFSRNCPHLLRRLTAHNRFNARLYGRTGVSWSFPPVIALQIAIPHLPSGCIARSSLSRLSSRAYGSGCRVHHPATERTYLVNDYLIFKVQQECCVHYLSIGSRREGCFYKYFFIRLIFFWNCLLRYRTKCCNFILRIAVESK